MTSHRASLSAIHTASPDRIPGASTRRGARRLALATLAGVAALGLAACGDDPQTESFGAPIVLSSTGTTPSPEPTEGEATPSATPSGASSTTSGAAPVAAVVRDGEANVDADDQGGDGRSVRVREVRLSAGTGHVVVIDPSTRQVLGTATVRAGTARDLTVPLTVPVARSGELVVLLHADDGDGRFDPATDGAVVDDDDLEAVDEDFDYTLR